MVLGIILAAGHGTRMKSSLPKVLHRVNGQPMIQRIVRQLGVLADRVVVVVNPSTHDAIRGVLSGYADLEYAIQDPPRGTGHAVRVAMEGMALDPHDPVLIVCGDTPLLHHSVMKDLLSVETSFGLLVGRFADPTGYGRIVVDEEDGSSVDIVEEKDCSQAESNINLVNGGVYVFPCGPLRQALKLLQPHNAQNELYLTDAVRLVQQQDRRCHLVEVPSSHHFVLQGVNTALQLASLDSLFSTAFVRLQDLPTSLTDVVGLLSHLTHAPFEEESCQLQYERILHSFPVIQVFGLYHSLTGLVALGTLLLEPKLLHGGRPVGHVEDVVVHPCLRGDGLGKRMVQHILDVAREAGCYKVILDASPSHHSFYHPLGFQLSASQHYELRLP